MFKPFLLFGFVFFTFFAFSQDKNYTLECVKKLSSPEFHGRGFVKNGDKKASQFIKQELQKWNVKPFNNTFFQYFPIDVNTITKAKINIDKKALSLGEDYLVYAASSTSKGDFKLYYLEQFELNSFSKEAHKNEIFVLDTIHYKSKELIENYRNIIATCAFENAAGLVEVTSRKLVHTQRTYSLGFPYLQIKTEDWDSTAQNIQLDIKNKLLNGYITQNVIGYIEGEIDSFYVFTAHYDHLGRLSKTVYFPGANDNASGVATVLDLAKYFSEQEKKPKYNIAFMLFSAEEVGLIGSLYYNQHPLFPLSKIKFLFNLDMVGTGVEGLSVVNGKSLPKASDLLVQINEENKGFDDIRIGKEAANSDHHFFYESGVPSVFLFTRGGPPYYHDIYDRAETLELNKHDELIQLLIQFINRYE